MKWPWVSRREYDREVQCRYAFAREHCEVKNALNLLYGTLQRGEKPDRKLMREVEEALKL